MSTNPVDVAPKIESVEISATFPAFPDDQKFNVDPADEDDDEYDEDDDMEDGADDDDRSKTSRSSSRKTGLKKARTLNRMQQQTADSTSSLSTNNPIPTAKRAIRLSKNREAARECRKKKKEYVKCLESRVAVLESQNKALIDELRLLKELYCKSMSDIKTGGGGVVLPVAVNASGGRNSRAGRKNSNAAAVPSTEGNLSQKLKTLQAKTTSIEPPNIAASMMPTAPVPATNFPMLATMPSGVGGPRIFFLQQPNMNNGLNALYTAAAAASNGIMPTFPTTSS